MDRILFRDVRCFRGVHELPFAPLTFLVGENSTGKSTLLALARIAWDIGHSAVEPDFNEDPFPWGSFNEIAHYHGGQGKRTRTFAAGYALEKLHRTIAPDSEAAVSIWATFSPRVGQPTLTSIEASSGSWGIRATDLGKGIEVFLRLPSGEHKLTEGGVPDFARPFGIRRLQVLLNQIQGWAVMEGSPTRSNREQGRLFSLDFDWTGELQQLATTFSREEGATLTAALGILSTSRSLYRTSRLSSTSRRSLAIAPVRTKPKRTYDPLREVRSSEGEHVPMMLARLRSTEPEVWQKLAEDLSDYGRGAGLFSSLEVKQFGKGDSAPFQVQVSLAGQRKEVNLVDVGYGVSQVLPILVDAFTQPDESSFLLQQPEVHLHPRAQAELGTILASLVKRKHHKFMIETHSDHLVDRVRLEVRRGKLPAESVRIVYCERADSQVLTHEIKLDSNGNLIGAPEGYRQFFLNEELALVGG